MRRLVRHVFTILSTLSLLLYIAICVLWLRSFWVYDTWRWQRRVLDGVTIARRVTDVRSEQGRLTFVRGTKELTFPYVVRPALLQPPRFAGFEYVALKRSDAPAITWRQDSLLHSLGFRASRTSAQTVTRVRGSPFPPSRAEAEELGVPRLVFAGSTVPVNERQLAVGVPTPLVVLALAVLPLTALARAARSNRRRRRGACIRCGYDLRASPERCPECGAANPRAV